MFERVEHLWWRTGAPPGPLRWASGIYAGINAWNLHRRGKNAIAPRIPLISVGNINVGGSGKTPFVIWLCARMQQHGYRPVVLCRGDAGRLSTPRRVDRNDMADEVGDEALLLARRCNTPVIAGRDRISACGMAEALGNVIILDDGFQYRRVKRACDIVLVPAEGIGNGCLLPAGPLREPVDALARADFIVRTGKGHAAPLTQTREWRWCARPQPLQPLCGHTASRPEKVLAVAGIARPWRLLSTLESQGIQVKKFMPFADHHHYRRKDVARIIASGLPVVTTEKDAVKLAPLWPEDALLWILPLEGIGEEGLPDAIIGTILAHSKQPA